MARRDLVSSAIFSAWICSWVVPLACRLRFLHMQPRVVPALPESAILAPWFLTRPASDVSSMDKHTANILHLEDATSDSGGAPLLSGTTLDINAGEPGAVMGPAGSGKPTLLHCMSGVLTPPSAQ